MKSKRPKPVNKGPKKPTVTATMKAARTLAEMNWKREHGG